MYKAKAIVFSLALFIWGVGMALLAWSHVRLPFNNPWDVVGELASLRINPADDLLRLAMVVGLPSLLLLLFSVSHRVRALLSRLTEGIHAERGPERVCLRGIGKFFSASVLFMILAALNVPTYHSWGDFDSFHEGESLGTSVSILAGRAPYKDVVFVHGVFQDPLRSLIAFKILGRSIGAARSVESFLKLVAYAFILLLLYMLFSGNWLHTHLVFLGLVLTSSCHILTRSPAILIVPPRDCMTFAFLIALAGTYEINRGNLSKPNVEIFAVASMAFIPIASLTYSIDRGFYLVATYLVIWPLLYRMSRHKGSGFNLIAGTILGILGGIVVMVWALKGQFAEFFHFIVKILPKYKELMDGKEYPIQRPCFLIPILFLAGGTFLTTWQVLGDVFREKGSLSGRLANALERRLVQLALLLVSIFFFRSAVGRSDWEHLSYSLGPLLILWSHILHRDYVNPLMSTKGKLIQNFEYGARFLLLLGYATMLYGATCCGALSENFPYDVPDAHYIPRSYRATIEFLRTHLAESDEFFCFTSEASWYYFLNIPCPVRFPVIWFASPSFYQDEVVEGLKSSRVKYILYGNNHPAHRIDGFPSQQRLPKINAYIVDNFELLRNFEGNQVWVRRTPRHPYISEDRSPLLVPACQTHGLLPVTFRSKSYSPL